MGQQTIYTKTAKGVLEVKNKTIKLPRDLERVFSLVDGKSTVEEILSRNTGMAYEEIDQALAKLTNEGFIKIFSSGAPPAILSASSALAAPVAGLNSPSGTPSS